MMYEVLYKENPESNTRKHLVFSRTIKEARETASEFHTREGKRVVIMKWKKGGVFTIAQIGAMK